MTTSSQEHETHDSSLPEAHLDHDVAECGTLIAKTADGAEIFCDLPKGHSGACSAPA